MILIFDFGSQTCHLISRRLRDLGIETEIVDPETDLRKVKEINPAGIIFSGGPASVYEKNAPTIDKKIFNLGVPILGICYGMQLIAYLLGGKVFEKRKEYGPTRLKVNNSKSLFYSLPNISTVWASHGDSVEKLPKGFKRLASTKDLHFAAIEYRDKRIFAVQFHPELSHTENGSLLLKNFAARICNQALIPKKINIREMINEIKEEVGTKIVIGAFSGGTDSSVAGTLVARAVGKQFIPLYVDSGLMREGTEERINNYFPKLWGVKIKVIRARRLFLKHLEGVTDPEKKRKVIGRLYIKLFEQEMKKYRNAEYLLQGTTYADFIHSQGSKRSTIIKSHHNVGGLPKKMKLKLIEPIRYFYTDQVRKLGLKLGLPKNIVYQQPFPGPGHAVRILGEVTFRKLKKQRLADAILVDELQKSSWYKKIFQTWTILTNSKSTAVKGDGRSFGDVIALRILNSTDRMTADWVKLPYNLLQRISSRIVNEVPGISRVVYDITTKPPATMEWE